MQVNVNVLSQRTAIVANYPSKMMQLKEQFMITVHDMGKATKG